MTNTQYQLANGKWDDTTEAQAEQMIARILSRESWYAPRVNREPMTTREQVVTALEGGNVLQHDDYWHAKIRIAPAPTLPLPEPELVMCSCGHMVAKNLVMSASMGTSCPDCYDRMSD